MDPNIVKVKTIPKQAAVLKRKRGNWSGQLYKLVTFGLTAKKGKAKPFIAGEERKGRKRSKMSDKVIWMKTGHT